MFNRKSSYALNKKDPNAIVYMDANEAIMQPTPNESRIHTDELVDIREVSVDKNLPKEERIAAFIRQIKNPYRFRCGDFVVNACFAGNGVTLEECLQGILR